MTETAPEQLGYEEFQRTRWPLAPAIAWTDPAVGDKTREAWKAAIDVAAGPLRAEITELREQLAALRAEHDKLLATGMTPDAIGYHADMMADRAVYKAVLERIAEEDTWVLDEGLSGDYREEHHVRVNLARQVLGLDVCGCTECQVSLGLDPPCDDTGQDGES